ncbi:nitrite/sulfite reductase [Actinoplanes sp. DH11]|uniref:nitrite/sulfite reductase n=1 Tax=Actinoplanes sp. DH11 TaxID=2857011 RepID=UPI001E5E3DD4|nr:nitrite/sulfite reductase [Actinoplanes sp. DH11]
MAPLRQSDTDACPGALRLHAAADGLLARVRLPAGELTGDQLRALRELTTEFGDGFLELTSRANFQVRGVRTEDAETLAARLRAAGLLPSETHDAVRNIAAPPLAGPTIRALTARLDSAILGDPALAALPGKFLFALGHVPLAADVAAVPGSLADGSGPDGSGPEFVIRLGGHDVGLRVAAGRVVAVLIAAAHAFLAERSAQRGAGAAAWRLRELRDGPARVAARVCADLGLSTVAVGPATSVEPLEPGDLLGVLAQPDSPLVSVGALVPLGRLGPVQLKVLEKAPRLVVTPWRGILAADLAPAGAPAWADRLNAAGLAVAPDSPWVGVTACAGRPGCAKSLADVRADAARTARFVDGLPVHWVGCDRACGSPAGRHVQVRATPDGYAVSHQATTGPAGHGGADGVRDLGELVAEARRS